MLLINRANIPANLSDGKRHSEGDIEGRSDERRAAKDRKEGRGQVRPGRN